MIATKNRASSQDEKRIFDSLIKFNFKPNNNKSVSRIAMEVVMQLTGIWVLTNLAIYVWRVCTGC